MGAIWVRIQANTVVVRGLVLQAFAAVPLVKHAAVLCLKALLKQSCCDVHWLWSSRFLDAVSIPQILKLL